MNTVKDIFKKYDDEISRSQYRNFDPTSNQNLNNENKKQYLKLILKINSFLKICNTILQGNLVRLMLQNLTMTKNNIKMIDNFVAHLFSHIEVKKHNTTINEIDYHVSRAL